MQTLTIMIPKRQEYSDYPSTYEEDYAVYHLAKSIIANKELFEIVKITSPDTKNINTYYKIKVMEKKDMVPVYSQIPELVKPSILIRIKLFFKKINKKNSINFKKD